MNKAYKSKTGHYSANGEENEITVRLASSNDAEQFSIWLGLKEEYELNKFSTDCGEGKMYIAFYKKKPLGYIRFEKSSDLQAEIVVRVDDKLQGQRLSAPMLQAAIKAYCQANEKISRLTAVISNDKSESIRMVKSIGFVDFICNPPVTGNQNSYALEIK